MCSQQVRRAARLRHRAQHKDKPTAAQDEHTSCCACSAEAGPDTAPLYTLKLQSVVLAAASPGHFRSYCTRLRWEGGGSSSAPAGKQRKPARVGTKRRASDTADQDTQSNVAPGQAYAYKLTLLPGEPESVPKAVLCHLYTGALPDDPDQLIWVSYKLHSAVHVAQLARSLTQRMCSHLVLSLPSKTVRRSAHSYCTLCPLRADAPSR